jgi:hypothetical protein
VAAAHQLKVLAVKSAQQVEAVAVQVVTTRVVLVLQIKVMQVGLDKHLTQMVAQVVAVVLVQ